MIRLCIWFCIAAALVLYMGSPSYADGKHLPLNKISQGSTQFVHQWSPDNLESGVQSLKVEVVMNKFVDGEKKYSIEFSKAGKRILSPEVVPGMLGMYPLSVFTLPDQNLATLWTTGLGGYIILNVFAYSNGRVHHVLHAMSKMYPELTYSSGILYSSRKNERIAYPQIIIANARWTDNKFGNTLAPDTADVYCWNGETYSVKKSQPWKNRQSRTCQ